MNWNKGFSATYYATFIDPVTWRDTERFEIISGNINRTASALRASADITCRTYDTTEERWIRIYLDTKQGESGEHVALFTGLATSPQTDINGIIKEYPLQCYSVLKPAEDVLLSRGWYAPGGVDAGSIIKELLNACPCPVEIADNAPFLSEPVIAEDSETHLSMTEKILNAINWRLRIHGDGTIEVTSQPDSEVATFDVLNNDSIEPQLTLAHDWFTCPNCFRAVNIDVSAVAKDENPASLLSTISRGREVWAEENGVDLSNDESIAEYAVRKLKELQQYYIKVNYSRRFHPDILVSDKVRLYYPAQGIDGVYNIASQSIELGHGARTSEEVTNGDITTEQ